MGTSRRKLLKDMAKWGLGIALSPVLHALGFASRARAQTPAAELSDLGVPVLSRGSPGFGAATRTYYPSPCGSPETVYQPRDEREVGVLINWLRIKRQRFAVRGFGHSFDNRSSNAKVIVDTSQLRRPGSGAVLDPGSGVVTVRAGTRLGGHGVNPKKTRLVGLYDELAKHNRILAAGTCPDVGVIGNILGGSLSAIPYLGYGSNALLEVTFVSFKDGDTYKVNANKIVVVDDRGNEKPVTLSDFSGKDLLRVFRGGGQGSLGIVTEIKLQSFPYSSFKAAELEPEKDLEKTIAWLSRMSPEVRKHIYFEAHFDDDGSSSQIMRAMAPANSWSNVIQSLSLQKRIKKQHGSAKDLLNSFLDNEGINSNQKQTRGANIMTPIDPAAINFQALRNAAKLGVDVAVYQGPSSGSTALHGGQGALMIEMEGNARHGDLNKLVVQVLAKGPRHRFANYVTTGVEAKEEEYFNESSLQQVKRAMEKFNPRVLDNHRISTSSLIDPAPSCGS